jgi:hypothetical protein
MLLQFRGHAGELEPGRKYVLEATSAGAVQKEKTDTGNLDDL